ncbi:Hypothetical predicted protein [Mytilus galloprovincialis]|uniref:Uncharacterized protein n=1 Tax=Mytilus galloprovincialis TaxID=29158 RepID=A0A8B6FU84_MYTGA|nr:Hypothetical predicted protein [Mytilus galloprovincialis]
MKVKWDKADLSKYTEIINEGLITSLQDINTKVDIETGFHDITAVIAKATNEIAQKPKTRKNKPKLKVMSDEILKAIRNKKSAFYYWKAKGRPTDSLDPFLLEKKITTQELRKICRSEVAQKRIQERNEIIEARSSNKTLFYKLINKQRGKLSRRIDELNVGDNIYNTPEQIMEGWKIHFGQLAENTLDENFDSNYLKTTENEYKNIIELCSEQFIHVDVTQEEISKAINSLNRNKAADFYGITAENIIHGGVNLLTYLQTLINKSFEKHFIPDSLKIGTLFPVFKNKGDCKNAKNYRGITVTPTFSKVIEKILKIRENCKIIIMSKSVTKRFHRKFITITL